MNHSAAKEIALLAFITGFAATLFGVRLMARVRSGWRLSAVSPHAQR